MSAYSIDVTAANFNQVVIEGSRAVPVLVDFWATWCAPCKTLKPILEKLAEEYQGQFILAKLETESNQEFASQFGIRSVPNVKAFVNGEVVDEFSGALPEGTVREFIDKLIPSQGQEMQELAIQVYAQGDIAGALQLLLKAAQADPANESIRIDMATILVDASEIDKAKRLIESLSQSTRSGQKVTELLARIEFAEKSKALPDQNTLEIRIQTNGNDLDARLQLANVLIAKQEYALGMDHLLEIIRLDRHYQDDIARKTMLSVFNLLGGQGDLVSAYRRLLASALN